MPSLNTGNAILSNPIKVDSSYNVGIGGAASGSFKLQVTGTTNLTGALTGTSLGLSSYLTAVAPSDIFYGMQIYGANGGARKIFVAGQTGFANGFTVDYNGSAFVYAFNEGNVGIGTSSPNNALVDAAAGGYESTQTVAINIGANIGVTGTRSTNTRKIGNITGQHYNNTDRISLLRYDSAVSDTSLKIGGTDELKGATSIEFATASSTTATPTVKLTIASTGAATFSSSVQATKVILSGGSDQSELTNSVNNDFKLTNSGNFRIINNSNTVALLTIANSGAATFSSSVSVGGDINLTGGEINSTGRILMDAGAGNGFLFRCDNVAVNAMTITSGGYVGIGVTPKTYFSTWKALQVSNLSLMGPGDGNGIIGANAYYDGNWKYTTSSKATLIELNQGPGDIRTYTTGSGTADNTISWTNGPYLANGGNSWTNGSSDVRKKKNFEPSQGLAELLQIEAIKYHFNWEDDNAVKRLGFKAQNLQTLIPEMVLETGEIAEDGSSYLTITPDYILPVLVKAIQELNQTVQNQQQQINSLINR